jgi:hypothetical protein
MGTIPAALRKPANQQQDGGRKEAGGKREVRQPLQGFSFYRAPGRRFDAPRPTADKGSRNV